MTDNEYIVHVDNVSKSFHTRHIFQRDEDTGRRILYRRRDVHAAQNISIGVRRGEVFGLLGPNGAGKTTTIKMICGLVKPTSGAIYVDGIHVEKKRLKALRKVGVVLEGTRTSIWPLTPLENLHYFGNLKDVKGRVLRERAREMLTFIGLKDKMNIPVRHLSRGEKQKLAICIALIADPPVILLDEPTTGLDVQSARNIKDRVIEMTREQGKSVLVTTHDMHVAQELCDRIGIINNGTLVACEPTERLLDLFSEQAYEFKLDRLPGENGWTALPGVTSAEIADRDDGPVLTVTTEADVEGRSRALYSVMRRLEERGVLLRAVQQRQQNLESVFLRITSEPALDHRRE